MINLPSNVEYIINTLMKSGFKGYAVGGCVRDSLIGLVPSDWDICTNAKPEDILSCFGEYKTLTVGIKHGTVTVFIDNQAYEITTFRRDGAYDDNRRPNSVEFVDELKYDLERRDFTINAMAYNNVDGLIDLFGSQKDLGLKKIKCVGDAEVRFEEDALRIMRALRFASVYGFEIEEKTANQIHNKMNLIENVSRERINVELGKLLLGDGRVNVAKEFPDMFKAIMPEIKQDSLVQSLEKTIGCETIEVILASIFYDCLDFNELEQVIQTSKLILKRLRFDNKLINTVKNILESSCWDFRATELNAKRLLYKFPKNTIDMILLFRVLCTGRQVDLIKQCIDKVVDGNQCYKIDMLKIDGDDLKRVGFEGKQIGEVFRQILEKVVVGELLNKKEDLIICAQKIKNC